MYTRQPNATKHFMKCSNYSVATVPRGVLTWICQNPETYKPKCHHRRWFTRATSQSPCLHGTLRSAAITIKTRKACFYRLNAFWLVTVKVLNSYNIFYLWLWLVARVKIKIGPPDQLMICNAKKATARITEFFLMWLLLFAKQLFYAREGTL